MAAQIPETDHGRALRARLSPERWARVVAEAQVRAQVFDSVVAHHAGGARTWLGAVAVVAAQTPWPTFVHWKRLCSRHTGPTWERLLDTRRPPPQPGLPKEIRDAACELRRADRAMSAEVARGHLMVRFGKAGKVSDACLKRVWAAAGVRYVAAPGGKVAKSGAAAPSVPGSRDEEEVTYFSGGSGLALIAAAEAELGCALELAKCALQEGQAHVAAQVVGKDLADDAADRSESGKFTAEYNARRRGSTPPGETDARWTSDAAKAALRPLATVSVVSLRPETLALKMLAMGVNPLLSERRGFNGLEGTTGSWLGLLGGTAYMPATLDKTLTELALLDVDDAMWQVHAGAWHQISVRWSAPESSWPRTVAYVDGTADPYWTRAFAKSGKVSRVGRVMPCVSRIAVNSGAGVPMLVETHAGSVSLKNRLLPMLAKLDGAVGPNASVDRLTIVDSEAGTAGTIWAMHEQTQMTFITVVKGQVLVGANVFHEEPWQKYREHDEVADVEVQLHGKGAPEDGFTIRGVQMRRADSRHPHTTLFVTNLHEDDVSAGQVADHYLARWPRQEQIFRKARNGGGLNRSHGYGGGYVVNVALVSKLEKIERSVQHAQTKHERAQVKRTELAKALVNAPAEVRRHGTALADREVRATEAQLSLRQEQRARLQTLPEQIYERDTGRDSLMTCIKLTVMALLEFVLKEYFGGAAMEWRTFIEQLVLLPVTMRSSKERCVYLFHDNPRHPELMAALAGAVAEINRRKLRRGKQLLVFEILPTPARGP